MSLLVMGLGIGASIAAIEGLKWAIMSTAPDATVEEILKNLNERAQSEFHSSLVVEEQSRLRAAEEAERYYGGLKSLAQDTSKGVIYGDDMASPMGPSMVDDTLMNHVAGKLGLSIEELRDAADPARVGDAKEAVMSAISDENFQQLRQTPQGMLPDMNPRMEEPY